MAVTYIHQGAEREPIPQESLERRFRFDLGHHILVDPESPQGFVSQASEVEPIDFEGHTVPVYEFSVVDPYVDADPEGYEKVRDYVAGLEAEIAKQGFNPLEERQKERPYQREGDPLPQNNEERRLNKFTRAWLADKQVQALKAWHSNVPHAAALGYLTNPFTSGIIVDKKGNPLPTTPETAAHLRFVDDAVAIRDRAVAMQFIAEDHLSRTEKDQEVNWVSLASGTAEPSIIASKKTMDATGAKINLTVVDYDATALEFVERNAQHHSFEGKVEPIVQDILSPDYPDKIEDATGITDGFDVVENMGFEEYLPQEGDELGAYRDMEFLPQASDFTANAWKLVKPGGVLISGNMIVDRPQIGFVFGVVGWPIINARSDASILRVYEKAGILADPQARVEMIRVKNELTGAHVYNIVKVTKLEDMNTASDRQDQQKTRLATVLTKLGLSSE